MSNKTDDKKEVNPNPYTQDDIRNMSYWELWGLRRKAGIFYFLILLSIYSFLAYLFLKVVYIFATKSFGDMAFSVDWWAVLLCLAFALIYYFFHEWYYKNKFLKEYPDKAIKED